MDTHRVSRMSTARGCITKSLAAGPAARAHPRSRLDTRMWDDQCALIRGALSRRPLRSARLRQVRIRGRSPIRACGRSRRAPQPSWQSRAPRSSGCRLGGAVAIDFALAYPAMTRRADRVDAALGGQHGRRHGAHRWRSACAKAARTDGIERGERSAGSRRHCSRPRRSNQRSARGSRRWWRSIPAGIGAVAIRSAVRSARDGAAARDSLRRPSSSSASAIVPDFHVMAETHRARHDRRAKIVSARRWPHGEHGSAGTSSIRVLGFLSWHLSLCWAGLQAT